MEKVLVVSLLVLASLRSASTEEYFIKEGGSVTLELRPAPSGPITIIQWKFKDSILAEWVKGVLPLTHNRENIKLDIVSGRLAMEKMTKAEEGVYSVEVNNNVQKETYNVVLIKDVTKPKIWVTPLKCSDEDHQCTLTCEGEIAGAEPVTYSWKTDNGDWKESGRDMLITKKEHGDVKDFTCKMKNPVSEKESDPLPNRLYIIKKKEQEGSSTGWIVGGIIFFLFAAAVGYVIWAWKNDKLPCWKRRTSSEFGTAENGMAHSSKAKEENKRLLEETSTNNTSPDEKTVSQEGPAGREEPPKSPHDVKTDSKEGPAGREEPPKSPHDVKTDSQEGPAGGEEPPKSPHDVKTDSQEGPAGGAEPPKSPHDVKTDSKDEPAGGAEPPKSPHDVKTDSKTEPAEEEADAEQVAKL